MRPSKTEFRGDEARLPVARLIERAVMSAPEGGLKML